MLHEVHGVVVQVGGGEPAPAADVLVPAEAADDGLDAVAAAVTTRPLAAHALLDVLRLTERLPVADGLVVESLAYSMLLAGPEHRRWLERRTGRRAPVPAADPVRLERDGDRLIVTLDRPERDNAISAAVRDALVDALEVGRADPSLEVVLRGTGRAFSIGGDLDEFGTTPDVVTAHLVRTRRSPARLLDQLGDRLTVEVHGACIGAGTELAAFGHRVLARGKAFFQLPELDMGLIPGAGGTVSVMRRIGRHRTAWLALTGRRIGVATALDWGLLDGRC